MMWATAITHASAIFAYIPLNAAHSPRGLPKGYYQQYVGKPGVTQEMAKIFQIA